MIPLFEAVVWSSMKLWIESSDLDVRAFCVDPNKLWIFPKNMYEWRPAHKLYDYDWWEVSYAIRQILRGDNSSPLLNSCLYSTDFKRMTDLGSELIDNRKKLLNQNLVKGTMKFCDAKISQSEWKRRKYHSGKYVYYAISDMLEQQSILLDGGVSYPLDSPLVPLLLSLKASDDMLEEWYSTYNTLKQGFSHINISCSPDIEWLNDWVMRCNRSLWGE